MPNWIGDFIMALSVLMHKQLTEPEDVTLILPEYIVGLSQKIAPFKCIPYKRSNHQELLDTTRAIRHCNFDRIYILPRSFSAAFMAFKTRIPVRIGLTGEWRRVLLSKRLPHSLFDKSRHITYEFAAVLNVLWSGPQSWNVRVKVEFPLPELRGTDYAVFCPGAAYGPAKVWPGFKELAERLPTGLALVILGSPKEQSVAQQIVSDSNATIKIFDYCGKTSLVEAYTIIQSAKVVIANDSGLMHIAGFCGVPLVGIFGSTSPQWTMALGGSALSVVADVACSPCFKRECSYGHYNCMKSISVDRVATALSSVYA